MAILDIEGVYKSYKSKRNVETKALSDISFEVNQNEMVAIMGRSGSGKTTLMNIISGILEPDSGKVSVDGNDISSMNKDDVAHLRRKKIGIVFQNYNLLDSLTIEENIKVPLIIDKNIDGMESKIYDISKFMGIENELKKYPYELSGGQQQRVGICRALINDAKLILADEPTGNLDSKSSEKVMEYFKKVCFDRKTSLLMVTHDPMTASYCDRVLFLRDGKIVANIVNDGKNMFNKILEGQKVYIS